MSREQPPSRSDYHWFTEIRTRWADNDIYGHVNNVVYYSYFDSIANLFLIEEGSFDIHNDANVGFVVNSSCNYFSPIVFPQKLTGAMRADRIGSSSVQYGLAIFAEDSDVASAAGTFTHVFVDRAENRPVPIPEPMRVALTSISAETP